MTEHKAKPEVWAAVERWCKNDMETLNCTLELRARVEALEAAAKPAEYRSGRTAEELISRVAEALDRTLGGSDAQARAVILEIAAWLQQHRDFRRWASLEIAADLERAAIQDPS